MKLKAWFDGACWPNPGGRAAYGWAVSDDGNFQFEGSGAIGEGPEMSNNVAEYMGLYEMLKFLKERGLQKNEIKIYGDSKLVVEQIGGRWRVKGGLYYEAFRLAWCMFKEFPNARVIWIPRYQNQLADSLSKRAMSWNEPPNWKASLNKKFEAVNDAY